MPSVCTDLAGRMRNAPSTPSRPSRPRSRAENDAATSRVASTSPSRMSQAVASSVIADLHVESDLEHVAVDHLVVLTLHPQLAYVFGGVPRPELEQLVPADHLGADEAALQVGVDDAGALGRLGA